MIKLRRGYFGLTFTCALCAGAFGAQAADLYRNPPPQTSYVPPAAYVDNYSWAGFYAGINGGYGWSNSGNAIQYNGGIVDGDSSGRSQPSGGFGGGQIGYNFQAGSFVYGLEADFQGGSIGDRTTGFTAVNGDDYNTHEDVDWFGTVRGRLGYAFGRTLIYGTASIPSVRAACQNVLPGARVSSGDLFGSVGRGLAIDAENRLRPKAGKSLKVRRA